MTRASKTADLGLRIIKTEAQHRRYLQEARHLMAKDPAPATPNGARLELLAKLIDDYERKRFPLKIGVGH